MQIYEVVLHCTCKSCRKQNSGGYRGEARGGGGRPPLIFRPNWSPKGRKNFFWVFWLVTDYERDKSVLNKSWTLSSKRTNKQTGVHIFVKICICGSWVFVLPCPKGTKKRATKNVQLVLQHCCKTNWCCAFYYQCSNLLTTWFVGRMVLSEWQNAQRRYSTRFAAMLQNKLPVFCCPFFRTLSCFVLFCFHCFFFSFFIPVSFSRLPESHSNC